MSAVKTAEDESVAAPQPSDPDGSDGPGPTNLVKRLLKAQAFQILLVLIVIILIFSALAPNHFAQYSNMRLIMQNASILAVLGVGMTFVIITAGIDLSIGSFLVFSAVVSSMVMRAMGGEGWGVAIVGILASIAAGTVWGFLNGVLIAKAKVPPLIVTLGTMGMALGFAQILTGGVDIRVVPTQLTSTLGYGNVFGVIPLIVVVALIFVLLGAVLLHFTRFGRYTYAIGSSEESARRVGVKVNAHLIKVYTLVGALCGVAGIMSLSQFGTTAIAGYSTTNLNVIAAVVIGGTSLFGGIGTIFGMIVGLFIPAVLQNGFVITGVQPFWQEVAVGAVLIGAVYVDQARRTSALRSGSKKGMWQRLFRGRSD